MASLHLTRDELALLMMEPGLTPKRRAEIKRALADDLRWTMLRKLPARRGVCAAGRRVVMDEKGAMASGYVLHDTSGYGVCSHGGVVWDPPSPQVAAIHAQMENLRRIAGR